MPWYRIGGAVMHLNMGSGKRAKKAVPACGFEVLVKGKRERCLCMAPLLCDWPGCDVPMCEAHALQLGRDLHVCPTHNARRGLLSRLLPAPAPRVKRCRYCEQPAQLLHSGEAGYPYRSDYGPIWVCVPCAAWVGCHPGTTKALGRLANAELRAAKQEAHAAFDPLWQRKMARDSCSKSQARKAGYRWLSVQLGIPYEKTHIGFFDLDECRRVVEVCNNRKKEK